MAPLIFAAYSNMHFTEEVQYQVEESKRVFFNHKNNYGDHVNSAINIKTVI